MALPPPPYETPGWYDDPEDSGKRRWWNGVQWTDDFQGSPTTPTPPIASPAALQVSQAEALLASLPGGGSPAAMRSLRRSAIGRLVVVLSTLFLIAIIAGVMVFRAGILGGTSGPSLPNIGTATNSVQVAETRDREHALLLQISSSWTADRPSSGEWPSSASIRHGVVVSSYGSTDVEIPHGYTLTYTPSSDRLGYTVALKDAHGVGMMYQQEYGLFTPTS
jgi:Protein of unknown function (DUF2510)